MLIEICIGYDAPQSIHTDFEHYGYYNSIDEAIEILQKLKKKESESMNES